MRESEETNVELLLSEPEIVKWLGLHEQKDDDAKHGEQRSLRTRSSRTSPRDGDVR
jgi:hypothetical protein